MHIFTMLSNFPHFPNGDIQSNNFSNVQFAKRQLPKGYGRPP